MGVALLHNALDGWDITEDDDGQVSGTSWVNGTAGDVVLALCVLPLHFLTRGIHHLDGAHLEHSFTIQPGGVLTIGPDEHNGPHITAVCAAAGLTLLE